MLSNMHTHMGKISAIILVLTSTSDAFWRMECRARSGFAQIDPLVSFAGVSEHIHAIHGGSGMSALFRPALIFVSGYSYRDVISSWKFLHFHILYSFTDPNSPAAFSPTSTTADLLESDCTSCAVSQDKSAYWTPAFYFQDAATGEFEVVEQIGGMLA